MDLFRLYARALGMLAAERGLALVLAIASVAIGVVQLAEPMLFGRVVDTLSGGGAAFPYIALWALLGLFGIVAGAALAVFADRLAHRRHLAAMAEAFERAMTLPAGYHAERGSAAVVRTILQGTDGLFWLWLGALREQLTALVGIMLLVPTAIRMDARMAAILGLLALAYVVMNTIADEILVFDGGRIVERGRFETLARANGLFARMVAEGGFTVPEAPKG